MPSWELTLAEVRGMSMPPKPEPMTEEKWAALEAAHEAGYIRFVNIVCRVCHGTGTVYMQHRQVFETDSDDETADAYSRESCPECKNLNLSVGAILAYHKKAEEIRQAAVNAERWLDDLIRLTTHIGRETNWNPKLTKHIEALGRLRAALGVNR